MGLFFTLPELAAHRAHGLCTHGILTATWCQCPTPLEGSLGLHPPAPQGLNGLQQTLKHSQLQASSPCKDSTLELVLRETRAVQDVPSATRNKAHSQVLPGGSLLSPGWDLAGPSSQLPCMVATTLPTTSETEQLWNI